MKKTNSKLSIDERMAVGCTIFEYLLPMTEDAYVMEVFVDFLIGTMSNKDQAETIINLIDLSVSNEQIKLLIKDLMQILARKLLQQKPEKFQERNDKDINCFKLIEKILKNERFKAAWLQSPYLFEDLEMIYGLHLLTKSEWQD